MFSSVLSAGIFGVDAFPVWVEADVSDGLPCFTMVGFVSSQVKEAQDRVRTALRNASLALPPKRITINLAPADMKKDGSWFDLPVAAAVLGAIGKVPFAALENAMLAGELGLDGAIRSVAGILSIVLKAKEMGCKKCIIPRGNENEGRVVEGIEIVSVGSILEFISYCNDGEKKKNSKNEAIIGEEKKESVDRIYESRRYNQGRAGREDEKWMGYDLDFKDVRGQEAVKRAALIAAAGFHNFLMIGPPGTGKSMIAKRIPTILPILSKEEQLEVTRIYSVAGLLPEGAALLNRRPFRSPHHTISQQALAGGGRIPKPGEITLSHRGVLFLDELPEMSKGSMEVLRQPLEDREIVISRVYGTVKFPASVLLVGAMNPCACGFYPDLNKCTCTATALNNYAGKISQPLLDRMDLCVEVPVVPFQEILKKESHGMDSIAMRSMVEKARRIQQDRYHGMGICFNSELSGTRVDEFCVLTEGGRRLLEQIFDKLELSARSYHRIMKTARTIADLQESELIEKAHLSEAVCFRSPDKNFWRI